MHAFLGVSVSRCPGLDSNSRAFSKSPKAVALSYCVHYRRHMDTSTTVKALAALAQESRLNVFRLLVRSGTEGMAAGEIARRLEIPHNTMSSQLSILTNSRLVASRRDGRSIIYNVNFDGTRKLLSFLMEDCCQGSPDLCAPVLDSLLTGCCAPPNTAGVSS